MYIKDIIYMYIYIHVFVSEKVCICMCVYVGMSQNRGAPNLCFLVKKRTFGAPLFETFPFGNRDRLDSLESLPHCRTSTSKAMLLI